jgi:hypothetical protein
MIVLFSYDGDTNTNQLIDWLEFYHCPYLRVDLSKENSKKIEIHLSDECVSIQLLLMSGKCLDFSTCAYFYTRGNGFPLQNAEKPKHLPRSVFETYINQEFSALTHFVYQEVNKRSIGCFCTNKHIKLRQLSREEERETE